MYSSKFEILKLTQVLLKKTSFSLFNCMLKNDIYNEKSKVSNPTFIYN